jgi:hypothetical protein
LQPREFGQKANENSKFRGLAGRGSNGFPAGRENQRIAVGDTGATRLPVGAEVPV